MEPRLPGDGNRTVIIGRTGTGKTVSGLWLLSEQDLEKPWIVLNFKNDEHIDSIKNTREIDYNYIPAKDDAGLFILRPLPRDGKLLEAYLWKIWERENCGIFCDEASMVGSNDAFDACLTQGRSKRIPMILCTQRPVWITRWAFSEASFIQVFDLNDQRDIDTVESFVPIDWEQELELKPHYSWYYEIDRNKIFKFKPCPPMPELRKRFAEKLYRKWVKI